MSGERVSVESPLQWWGNDRGNTSHSCRTGNIDGRMNWMAVKSILFEIVARPQEGFKRLQTSFDGLWDLMGDHRSAEVCPAGLYCLKLAMLFLMPKDERAESLCQEPNPFSALPGSNQGLGVAEWLASGWPVFGLMGLLGYRLVRDGVVPGLHSGSQPRLDCGAETESFRIRYSAAAFNAEDVQFSRDVERHVLEVVRTASDLPQFPGNTSQSCLFGAALPILGHVASLQCLARRSLRVRKFLGELLLLAEARFLKPAAQLRRGSCTASRGARELRRLCQRTSQENNLLNSALGTLASGLWGAEAFMLFHGRPRWPPSIKRWRASEVAFIEKHKQP
mmetsp:Transcript_9104/g.19733  ORF Transcript_9104/g.19733 Transcript_9104/m.19733 type:complete len:336 (-) Transcript_9104:196-1203(-)